MRPGLRLGPAELSPQTRRRVDRDSWLLTVWWLCVGLAATVLLHRVGGVRAPVWRYPLTALLMYLLGDVAALRAWLALFARDVRSAPARWRVATDDERSSASALDVSRLTLFFAAVLVAVIAVTGVVVRLLRLAYGDIVMVALVVGIGVLAAFALLNFWLPTSSSGPPLMTDLALGFVFGRSVGREVLPPLPRRESLALIVGETWPRGVALVVLATLLGATLALLWPGAESLADAFP